MPTEVEDIKREIAGLAAHKNARRYPPLLQQRITKFARMKIAVGVSRAEVCRELDIGEPTMQQFLKGRPTVPAFRQVRVIARRDVPVAPRTVTVRGPCGTSIEGLSLNEAVTLLWKLACSA